MALQNLHMTQLTNSNAQHYVKMLCINNNKTTINKQILWRFKKCFFQRSKNWNTPFYLQMFCALSGRSVSWNTPFSAILPLENKRTSSVAIFFTLMCFSSFKGASPKVLWGKVISRRSKELKSDPGSCPLVLGAILKIWVTSSYIQFWLWPGLVTKIQTTTLSILPRFYFHDVLGQLKSNFHANFRFKRVLGFVTEHAWISKLLHDGAFTWRPRELSRRLKIYLILGNFAI